ncbi:MAG: hypothetical protein AMXMBFR48_02190 [Ignavibacteriales bacterium]
MSESIKNKVFLKIRRAKRGTLFFAEDFLSIGSTKTVNKTLERLTAEGELVRVTRGIYVRPIKDSIVGTIMPTTEEIAFAIAKRDKTRIVPIGSKALNLLGLSTQVPLNVVYLTDGSARKIRIGNRKITFKKTSPKNLAGVGEISQLVIQALRSIGEKNLNDELLHKIQLLLSKEKPNRLEHDIRLAPAWIREIMKPVLRKSVHV